VRMHVYTALKRANIKLAVAEQSVHFTKESEKHEEAEHQRELARRFKTLGRVELFSQMSDEELHNLAKRLKYKPFAKGSVITKQGTPSQHWLFIIINGEAEVSLEGSHGEKHVLNVLSKGDFFGEMSLMTGAPRVASVTARTDLECYRLDKEAFEEFMMARPSIAEEVAQVLVERRAQLDAARQQVNDEARGKVIQPQRSEVLETVKRFFGL
jgi:CRP-like cAMP-binding protein